MRNRMHDRIIGVLLILFSIWYMVETSNFRRAMLSDPVGPRLFPQILGGLMIALSIYLIIRPDENVAWPKGESWLRIGLVTLSFIAYAYLLVPLGFIVTTTLEMLALAILFGGPPLRALIARPFSALHSTVCSIFCSVWGCRRARYSCASWEGASPWT